MATVYLGHDLKHDRKVAPKVLGDRRRFITNVPVAAGPFTSGPRAPRCLILQNWLGELRRLTATRPQ